MKVLVTGGLGFIGSHVVDDLSTAATRSSCSTPSTRPRTPGCPSTPTPPPTSGWRRSTTRTRMRRRRRRGRRRLPPGGQGRARRRLRRRRALRPRQRRRHRRPAAGALADRVPRAARRGLLDGRLRRGPVPVRRARHGPARAPLRRRPRRRPVRAAVPALRPSRWRGRRVPEDAPARPPQRLRRDQAAHRAPRHRLRPGVGSVGRAPSATTTSTGPGCRSGSPYAGVASIFRSSLEAGRAAAVFEDGGQLRDFVHVSDVARANVLALDSSWQGPFNVASGEPHTVLDMATALAGAFGAGRCAPVVTGDYRLGDVRHVVASPGPRRRRLGFVAEVPFADGDGRLRHRSPPLAVLTTDVGGAGGDRTHDQGIMSPAL